MDIIIDCLATIAGVMGINTANLTNEEVAKAVVDRIKELINILEIPQNPQNLKDYEVSAEMVDDMSVAALDVKRLIDG